MFKRFWRRITDSIPLILASTILVGLVSLLPGVPVLGASIPAYYAVALNGSTSTYLDAGSNATLQLDGDDWTLDMWITFDSITQDQGIFEQGIGVAIKQYVYWHSVNKKLYWRVYNAGGGLVVDYDADWDPQANKWYLLSLMHDGDNWQAFINAECMGTLVDSDDIAAGVDYTYFGNGAVHGLDGSLDEIRLYTRALSMEELVEGRFTRSWVWDKGPLLADVGGEVEVSYNGTGYDLLYSGYDTVADYDTFHATGISINGTFNPDIANPVADISGGHGGLGVLYDPATHVLLTRSLTDLGLGVNATQRYWMVAATGGGVASTVRLYWSVNLSNWTSYGDVLAPGALGQWDDENGVGGLGYDGLVLFEDGGTFYLIYEGDTSDGINKTGMATSINLTNWTKSPTNPILEGTSSTWDHRLRVQDVWKTNSTYIMLYTGLNPVSQPYESLGMVTTTDWITFTRNPNNPIEEGTTFDRHISDFSLYRTGTRDYVYYESNVGPAVRRMYTTNISTAVSNQNALGQAGYGRLTVPSSASLVSWWHLDEGSGVTGNDLVGPNDITLTGNASWVDGFAGTLQCPTVAESGLSYDRDGVVSGLFNGNLTNIDGITLSADVYFQFGLFPLFTTNTTTQVLSTVETFTAALPTTLEPGETYQFRTVAQNVDSMNFGSTQTFTLALPTVTTTGAAGVSMEGGGGTRADLTGSIPALGDATGAYGFFQYGTDTTYGTNTTVQAIGLGPFSASITGFIPGQTYHYRSVVRIGPSSTYVFGTDSSFATTVSIIYNLLMVVVTIVYIAITILMVWALAASGASPVYVVVLAAILILLGSSGVQTIVNALVNAFR